MSLTRRSILCLLWSSKTDRVKKKDVQNQKYYLLRLVCDFDCYVYFSGIQGVGVRGSGQLCFTVDGRCKTLTGILNKGYLEWIMCGPLVEPFSSLDHENDP